MFILGLIAIIAGFVSLSYGNFLNLDGHCFDRDMTNVFTNLLKYGATTPGETFVTIGCIVSTIGIILLFIPILSNKKQSLKTNLSLSLDLVIPSVMMLFGILFSLIGQSEYQSVGDDLRNIENILYDDSYVLKIALKAVYGQQFIMWGLIFVAIGGIILIFNILQRLFSTERALAIYITASALLSALFLIMKPMYGLVIPNTDDKVDFYIKPFSFMSDNGIYDISPSYINLWCTLFFILIFAFIALTVASQFNTMPKISLISSIGIFGTLLLMFLGLMAIYSLCNNNIFIGHSITVSVEYAYCLLLSLFIMIANFIRTNIIESGN